jgi:hypothetical protein
MKGGRMADRRIRAPRATRETPAEQGLAFKAAQEQMKQDAALRRQRAEEARKGAARGR